MRYLYGIYDTKADMIVGQIMTISSDAAAVRTFCDILADTQSQLHAHMSDYNLVKLGELITENQEPQIKNTNTETILTGKAVQQVTEQNKKQNEKQLTEAAQLSLINN